MTPFKIKQGDRRPYLYATLGPLNDDGEVTEGTEQDLTAATVAFNMKDANGNLVIDHAPVAIDDLDGKVHYHWQEGDTDVAGKFFGEFEVTFDDDEQLTFPNGKRGFAILITEQLA